MSQLRDGSEILGIPIIRNAGLENPFFLGGCGFTSGLDSGCGGSGLVSLIVGDDLLRVQELLVSMMIEREKNFWPKKSLQQFSKRFPLYKSI